MDISEIQDSIEQMAILMAGYYNTLVRNGVPEEMAQRLTESFQVEQLKASYTKASIENIKQFIGNNIKRT